MTNAVACRASHHHSEPRLLSGTRAGFRLPVVFCVGLFLFSWASSWSLADSGVASDGRVDGRWQTPTPLPASPLWDAENARLDGESSFWEKHGSAGVDHVRAVTLPPRSKCLAAAVFASQSTGPAWAKSLLTMGCLLRI